MGLEQPAYWLVYVPESTESGVTEVAAIAPERLPQDRFCRDTQWLLAAAAGYRAHHPDLRVVFAGETTRWLGSRGVGMGQLRRRP